MTSSLQVTETTRKTRKKREHRHHSLYNYAREVIRNPIVVAQPHLEMCKFLNYLTKDLGEANTEGAEQKKGMLLVPRGTGKTALGSTDLTLQVLDFYPNARILFDGATHGASKERLQAVKWEMEFNENFREFRGDWVTGAPRWREELITTNRRTIALKEPSIDTAGIDKPKNGGHYELIIADDLVNEINVMALGQRRKAITHLQSLYPLLAPGGTLLLIGTRWAENDLYSWVINKDLEYEKRGEAPAYMKMIRGAINDDGTLYAPTLLGDRQLAQHRRDMEPWLYSCNYLNKALSESSQVFSPETLRWYEGTIHSGTPPYLDMNALL